MSFLTQKVRLIDALVICLSLLFLLQVSCSKKTPVLSNESDVWVYEKLSHLSPLGAWDLFLGAKGEIGLPAEAFLHVFAKKGNVVYEIIEPQSLTNLIGVRIATSNDALAVVRFFTQKRLASVLSFPHYVDLSDQYNKVSIMSENGNFIIERELGYLESADQNDIPVYRVREMIKQDGSYQVERLKKTGSLSREALSLPLLE